MDERKRPARKFLKYFFLIGCLGFFLISLYGGIIYWQTQTIEDPNKCFTTSMYKVRLCPSSGSYVRYKEVPQHFFQSLILSEDASFYSHKGFDWFEIKESFRRNFQEWKFSRGGSTLTQQLAKNLYLSKEKTLSRKFKEIFISKQIEKRLTKFQILEKYINVVEFGKGIYGLRKASNHYFDKSPALLNVLESIFLVSLLPSPERLSRGFHSRKLSRSNKWRMKIILKRLYRFKKINDELFVYLEVLIDESAWPFDEFSEDMFDLKSIEEQMLLEFDEADSDEVFLEDSSNGGVPGQVDEPLEDGDTSEEVDESKPEQNEEDLTEEEKSEEENEDSESTPEKDDDSVLDNSTEELSRETDSI